MIKGFKKSNIKVYFNSITTILALIILFFFINNSLDLISKPTSKAKKATKHVKSVTKSKVTSAKSKKLSKAAKPASKRSLKNKKVSKKQSKLSKIKPRKPFFEVVSDTLLSPGIYYKNIHIGRGRTFQSVHVLEADLINSEVKPAILKAKNLATELEKLQDMGRFHDSTENTNVLGAVNGNFWRAYSNTPIGPTVINGEVVELKTHKQWSSGFFDEEDRLWIDNFFMNGFIELSNGQSIAIQNVNRRLDSSGVILYNRFGGDTIPFIKKNVIEEEILRKIKETVENQKQDTLQLNDSTEVEFDTLKLKQELINVTRAAMLENSLKKISLKYIDEPSINHDIRCLVLSVDSCPVPVPKNGCIISFGTDISSKEIPRKKDTVTIKFTTNVYTDKVFWNSVSGTPRLVRNGIAKHEAYQEGSKGRRFISKPLPRTAIGTDKFRRKLYLVIVEGGGKEGKEGANLQQMANIMKQIGSYNAMNLDGGGSTTMILNNKNIVYKSNPESCRKLSVGIAIVLEKSALNKMLLNNK